PDLVFPHHENEIAQSECATGKPLARFWLHNGYINVNNEKMSKSAGNSFMVRDAAKKYGYKAIRYFVLASQYRSPINFSDDVMEQCASSVERLQNCETNLRFRLKNAAESAVTESEKETLGKLEDKKASFIEVMDDDFNTADGLGILFDMTRMINTALADENASKEFIEKAFEIHYELLSLMGFETEQAENGDDEKIEAMVKERSEAKKAKDYKRADEIREELKKMGVVIEDTPQGPKWKRA
ncbi:MAG: class I tRNA ligase family protein, partial [Clostridia bacterium]|nr:class I tRNA ligase family protein [Clostridia bacterium]